MRYHVLTSELIRVSGEKARALGHSYVGTIHILLALMEQPGFIGNLFRYLGAEPEITAALIQLLYGTGTPELPLPFGLTGKAKELLHGAARERQNQSSPIKTFSSK